jgi:hypothetical protein
MEGFNSLGFSNAIERRHPLVTLDPTLSAQSSASSEPALVQPTARATRSSLISTISASYSSATRPATPLSDARGRSPSTIGKRARRPSGAPSSTRKWTPRGEPLRSSPPPVPFPDRKRYAWMEEFSSCVAEPPAARAPRKNSRKKHFGASIGRDPLRSRPFLGVGCYPSTREC